MALEDAIKELTAAVQAQTAFMTKMAARGAKPAAASGDKAPDAGPAVDQAKVAAKAAKAGAKPKAPTVEELGEKATTYVRGATDRDEAKANIVKISAKFGAERFTAIAEESRAEALALLAQYAEGEDPLADEDDSDEDDSPEI